MDNRALEERLRQAAATYRHTLTGTPGFEERILARTAITPGWAPHRSRRVGRGFDTQMLPLVPALVAAVLAIAIVATLLFVAHERQAVLVAPGPHRSIPYTIASPPSVAAGCSSVPRQWASSRPNPAKMLSATTGWAYGPMRTTDGGMHWLDVSPPSIPDRTNKNDEYFLDATHAWVAETASSPGACVDHVVIFSTVDGGRSWQQAAAIPLRLTVPGDVIWTGETNHASWFYFVDPHNGWLLVGSGPVTPAGSGIDSSWLGAGWRLGDLYRTTDGGLHWTLATTIPRSAVGCPPAPLNGQLHESVMTFASPSTGWMVTTCGLLTTHDGGLTWANTPTPLTPTEAPVFFDKTHGLVFVGAGAMMVTSDGGATWSVRVVPASTYGVDFSSPSQGWAVGLGANPSSIECPQPGSKRDACHGNFQVYRTSDGGKNWVAGSTTSLLMPAPKYWPPAYLHFVDAKTGFLDPGGPLQGVFKTTDGGSTWTAVSGTVHGP